MSCVIAILVLLVIALLTGPWVLLGLQYRRQREQTARLDDLQRELTTVGRQLKLLARCRQQLLRLHARDERDEPRVHHGELVEAPALAEPPSIADQALRDVERADV